MLDYLKQTLVAFLGSFLESLHFVFRGLEVLKVLCKFFFSFEQLLEERHESLNVFVSAERDLHEQLLHFPFVLLQKLSQILLLQIRVSVLTLVVLDILQSHLFVERPEGFVALLEAMRTKTQIAV